MMLSSRRIIGLGSPFFVAMLYFQVGCSQQQPLLTVQQLAAGQVLPTDVQFAGSDFRKQNSHGMVAFWGEPIPNDNKHLKAVQGVYIFTEPSGIITGMQWARSRHEGEWILFDTFIEVVVPDRFFIAPRQPSAEMASIGRTGQHRRAQGLDNVDDLDGEVNLLLDELYSEWLHHVFAKGLLDSRLPENAKLDPLMRGWKSRFCEPREPTNLGEYVCSFVGRTPDAELFPEPSHAMQAQVAMAWLLKECYVSGVLVPLFTFYDLGDLTKEGFDKSLDFFFAVPVEARVRHLGGCRVRIDAVMRFRQG